MSQFSNPKSLKPSPEPASCRLAESGLGDLVHEHTPTTNNYYEYDWKGTRQLIVNQFNGCDINARDVPN